MQNNIEDIYPLSPLQQGILFHSLYSEQPGTYFNQLSCTLRGDLDIPAFTQTWQRVLDRHSALRTAFLWKRRDEPLQVVYRRMELPIEQIDWRDLAEDERRLEDFLTADRERGFDLSKAPLIRLTLIRLAEDRYQFIWSSHQLMMDGWSVGLILKEVFALYDSLRNGQEIRLRACRPFADYIGWLQLQDLSEAERFWRETLKGFRKPTPLTLARAGLEHIGEASSLSQEQIRIPEQTTATLDAFARQQRLTINTLVQGAWALLLSRYSGEADVLFGATVSGRPAELPEVESMVGLFINTLPVRVIVSPGERVITWLKELQAHHAELRQYEYSPLVKIQGWSEVPGGVPLFDTIMIFENYPIDSSLQNRGEEQDGLKVENVAPIEGTNYPISLIVEPGRRLSLQIAYDRHHHDAAAIRRMLMHLRMLLEAIIQNHDARLSGLSMLTITERQQMLVKWNDTRMAYPSDECIHHLFDRQVELTPDAIAVVFKREQITYRELRREANKLAHKLQRLGVGPEVRVGICAQRSLEMVVGLLGILKAGGAYVPLDPKYPKVRVSFMLDDAQSPVLLTQHRLLDRLPKHDAHVIYLDAREEVLESGGEPLVSRTKANNLAYVIYTSGSTGKPKGVMVSHQQVVNFLTGMDRCLGNESPGTWLAVTSISFDISVLEIFWTLTRGFMVVVQSELEEARLSLKAPGRAANRKIDFSLFYFASDDAEDTQNKYRLLIDGAKFADRHGFAAVWTPERHFHSFGGLYPNPSLAGAALAAITDRIGIRAGSVVLPLHSSIRVAEEWSFVDNLSNGRAGVSFASGWHANDFVFAPANYAVRREVMFREIEAVRKLWRGEPLPYVGGAGNQVEIKIRPRPIQPELPVWVTAAGSPETFSMAGEMGTNLLTHLLGQGIDDLAEKIAVYRQAWKKHGHGPGEGHVTLMLHTYVGENLDVIREKVRAPFTNYLRSSVGLVKDFGRSVGWDVDSQSFTEEDLEALLSHAFERYFVTSGLFGTPETCLEMINRLKLLGVDEVACLIDFGLDFDSVMSGLHHLNKLREFSNQSYQIDRSESEAEQIIKHNVTHLQCTPSMAKMLMMDTQAIDALPLLSDLMLGGEALPPALAQALFPIVAGEIRNLYGPTETTVYSTTYTFSKIETSVSIGRPVANTEIYILDAQLQPLPVGVPGQLYIGGDGVVRGYHSRPDLTAEKFIPDPFSAVPGLLLYGTGDLAAYLPDGQIEYLGRMDYQVKLRGHRIEVGEIEAVLNEHGQVRESVVVGREEEGGEKRLVGYVVMEEGQEVRSEELREYIGERLPEYMVPGVIVQLASLPLTPNGKLDRKALPAPQPAPSDSTLPITSANPIQEIIAALWMELLATDRLALTDNFFDLGGHSLLAMQLVSRLKAAFGLDFALRQVFEAPTLAEQSRLIQERRKQPAAAASPALMRVSREADLPLSFGQQRLWFLDQMEPGNSFYNIVSAVRLAGELNLAALGETLSEIVRRHEVLRTAIVVVDGEPRQHIKEAEAVRVKRLDLRGLGEAAREAEAQRQAVAAAQAGFDLGSGEVLRVVAMQMSETEHVVVLVMHHIASDGWSMEILRREVRQMYEARVRGEEIEMAEMEVQYGDYAVWQRERLKGEVLDEEMSYWKGQLAGVGRLEMATDRVRPVVQSYRGATEEFVIGEAASAGLKRESRRQGVTMYMSLLGVVEVMLGRYSGQEEVVVGTPVAGRGKKEVEGLIGFFVNTLVMRNRVRGRMKYEELMKEVREVCLGAYEHQEMPFEKLVEEMEVERDLSRSPLFQVMFILQNAPEEVVESSGVMLEAVKVEMPTSRFDLTLGLVDSGKEFHGTVEYSTDLFDGSTIRRMIGHFKNLLRAIITDPDQRIADLPMLSDQELKQLLFDWNDTATDYEQDQFVHQIIESQVLLTPDRIALSFDNACLSYLHLNRRANQLAHCLAAAGIAPDALVGICATRSLDLVIAILGVLKAGAAYLPLEPSYPPDRLRFMLEDAQVHCLLTQAAHLPQLPEPSPPVICLDRDEQALSRYASRNPSCRLSPDNLAYVIYTSGSTGQPKAVPNTHGGLRNRLLWMQATYGLEAETVLQKTPFSFDVSVWEFLWPLMVGGRLAVAVAEGHKDADYLVEVIQQQQVSIVHFVPSMLQAFVEAVGVEGCVSLREVICSGEALPYEYQERFYEKLGCGLNNLYGPTEAAIDVTSWRCEAGGERQVPLGRPIANTQIYVMDGEQEVVGVGIRGEIYIGGAGLARGYLGRAEMTAARFVPDGSSGEGGARLYRSGDLGRYLADGRIEYLGRGDRQVKVRGHRIELGEIESVLRGHPGVRECVVEGRGAGGQQRLVGYVVKAGERIEERELRKYLKERLPEYMQVGVYVEMGELPLTSNGKVDRRRLPEVGEVGGKAGEYEEASSQVEQELVRIWGEVLGVKRVGVRDNFFEMGGDSILSIQVVARAAAVGLQISPRQMFQQQTVAELAQVAQVRGARGEAGEGEMRAVSGAARLTPIQRWFFEQEVEEGWHYNQAVMLEGRQEMRGEWVGEVYGALVEQHDALRLRFREREGVWEQEVEEAAEARREGYTEIDLREVSDEHLRGLIEAAAERVQRSLDLERGPMARLCLFSVGDGKAGEGKAGGDGIGRSERSEGERSARGGSRVLMVIHHLGVDGVSWRVLLEDLQLGYEQLARGEGVRLLPATLAYTRWAERLAEYAQSAEMGEEIGYWQRQAEQAVGRLPVAAGGGEASQRRVSGLRQVRASLSQEETRRLLVEVPGVYQTQIDEVLLSGLGEVLCQWAGAERLEVEMEGHGREVGEEGWEVSRTVGWFTSIYPVVVERREGEGVGERLKRVKEEMRRIPGKGSGYGVLKYLREEEGLRQRISRESGAEVLFNYWGQMDQMIRTGEDGLFRVARETSGENQSPFAKRRYSIEVNSMVMGGRLTVEWSYNEGEQEEATMAQLAVAYVEELQRVIRHCQEAGAGGYTVSDFEMAGLNQEELEAVVGGRRDIQDIYPLTPMQEGMLFHTQLAPQSGMYLTQLSCELVGEIDVAAFEGAWEEVVRANAVLRSEFVWQGLERPLQVVRQAVRLQLAQADWRGQTEAEQRAALVAYEEEERRGLDVQRGLLMRLSLVRLGGQKYQFIWTHHHLLLDGWSVGQVVGEVFENYERLRRGEPVEAKRRRKYRDYIEWLSKQNIEEAESYWRQALQGFTTPTNLRTRRTDANHAFPEISLQEQQGTLSQQELTTLENIGRQNQLTLNTLVQGAWAVLLSRYSGEQDIVYGATVSGRPAQLAGIEAMVGMFINTLPVRARLTRGAHLVPWLQTLQEQQAEMRQYEYSSLVQVQEWSELPRGQAMFESILVFENYPIDALSYSGAEDGTALRMQYAPAVESTNYPLNVVVVPGKELLLRILYDPRHYQTATISRMLGHLKMILRTIARRPQIGLWELSLLQETERRQLLDAVNDTETNYPSDESVARLFEAQVTRRGDAIAVSFVGSELCLSYTALNRRANQVAHYLKSIGIGSEARVAICVERSLDMVVGILAILKAGGAYVPIDADYPTERLAFMLEDAGVEVLLTQQGFLERLHEPDLHLVCLDSDWDLISAHGVDNPAHMTTGESLAYVIYTSGSTGQPKGVAVTHRAVSRLIYNTNYVDLNDVDRIAQASNSSFDAMTFELWGALLKGAQLIGMTKSLMLSPHEFAAQLNEQRITTLFLTTALFNQLAAEVPEVFRHLRHLLFGGELVDRKWVREILSHGQPERLLHVYGPTESTTFSSWQLVEDVPEEADTVPIGKPISNTELYILDSDLQPTPIGLPGEIYIGGDGLARNYLNRSDLTAEKFIPSPINRRAGARLYKTGDLACFLPDGSIEFIGRVDDQVKIRGFRIELGEIESLLNQHPDVQEAVVVARQVVEGDKRLVAYVVMRPGSDIPGTELRDYLKRRLPDYMTPASFVQMQALPLNRNGKVDRELLPSPDRSRPELEKDYLAPRTEVEEKLVDIWKQVLDLEQIGVEDNLFEIGGNSLLATRIISRVREAFQKEVPLRSLFETSTIAGLASTISNGGDETVYGIIRSADAESGPLLSSIDQLSNDEVEALLSSMLAEEEVGE